MKNKLHILLFCENDHDLLEQRQTGLFAIDLVNQGFDVSILIDNCNHISKLESIYEKIKIYYTKSPKWYQKHMGFYNFNIKEILKKDDSIDIVQVMSCSYDSSFIAKACHKQSIPCLARVRHKSMRQFRELDKIKSYILKQNIKLFTKVIVNAEYLLTIAKEHDLHNLTLIYDGIYTKNLKGVFNKAPLRKKLGLPTKTMLLTCPANILRSNKQFETIKTLMPLSEKRQLVILGDIEDSAYLKTLIREIDFLKVQDYVHFLPNVDNSIDYINASDLLILIGGIEDRIETILLSQALGVPVVLGQSPSSLFLTNASRCGVVLYEDNILVQQALDRLLNDSVYRQSRGVNARQFVMDLFTREKMIDDYTKLYSSL
jgi:glycosyltransferase involved in cell wall biosynthesis